MRIAIEPHPDLQLESFVLEFEQPLDQVTSPHWLQSLLRVDRDVPVRRSEENRKIIRDLLRHGGYKPTGRGKPASEYLLRAATEAGLNSINVAVDLGNCVSLHSGIPVSVVDCDKLEGSLRVGIAAADAKYVFNPAGQEIDPEGLLCLHDSEGPCANAVKDAQRSKTSDTTRSVLCLMWGSQQLREYVEKASAWYVELARRAEGRVVETEHVTSP